MNTSYRPTGETALVIVPPSDVCGYADHYRRTYMRDTMHHIEPHITVVSPFAPYNKLEEIEPKLVEVLSKVPPRRLSLRGFGSFPDEGVLYLRLADEERVVSICRAVFEAFPEYPAYGGKFGDNIIPHLTVGTFEDHDELARVYNELSVQKLYIGFDVEKLVLKFQTDDDGIWDTWAEIPLGGAL